MTEEQQEESTAPTSTSAPLNDGNDASEVHNQDEASNIEAEMEKANEMKIGELKIKLQAMGVLTTAFCEKSEFVRAYAEAVVKKGSQAQEENTNGQPENISTVVVASDESDDDDDEGNGNYVMSELPTYVKHRVEKLRNLHEQREKLLQYYLKERVQLEAKFEAMYKPLYQERTRIVKGEMDQEIAKEHPSDKAENGENLVGVPQFWVCALSHMDVVAELITEEDVDCLEHLQDITCIDDENGEGFTLRFHFAPNDYFHDPVLTKRYEVPNLLLSDEPIMKNVEGCSIQWKPGKSLTHREVTKKQRGKGKNAGQIRTVKSTERKESFFHFFKPPKLPSLEMMDEEEADRLEHEFVEDYDIAQAFRSHIIPKAVLWFTGKAMEQEMEDALAGTEGLAWPGGADGSTPSPASAGEENPECKQS